MQADNQQEYLLTTPEDIYGALRKIVLMGSPVVIKIDGDDNEYRTAMTHTSFRSNSFFMDKVIPIHGNDLIRSGKRFSVECDSQGVHIEFHVNGRLRYQPEREQYRGEFPQEVLYLQRRTAYRVNVPPAHQILLKLKMMDDQEDLIAKLVDLSSSGFKALFQGDVRERLEQQRDFQIARVRFNRENTMDCSIEARHIVTDEDGNTLCGFSFALVSPQAQRYIDRLITEFQWEERRQKEQKKDEFSDI